MDYWEYIAHSQQGAERKDHRYYARVQTGTNNGRAVYRYFYTADEYSAYRNAANRNVEKQKNAAQREKTRTNIRAAKVKMDAERYRKQRFAENTEKRNKWKRSVDRERTRENIASQKAAMDRERNKRLRGEKHAQRITEAKAQQVQKDAYAYRRGKAREKLMAQKAENARNARGQKHADRITQAKAEQVQKDARAYRRKRTQTSVRSQKVQMDAERYRKQKRAEKTAKRNALKAQMDRERNNRLRGEKHADRITQAKAEQVQKDAAAYRTKRIADQVKKDAIAYRRKRTKASVKKQKTAMDRKRTQTSIRAQKVKMDAQRYRRKKRAAAKSRRDFQKRVMDNTRTRKSYQPTMV